MTVKLHDAGANDGLFDILGKAFHAQSTLNTARGTTIPTEIEDAIQSVDAVADDPDIETITGRLAPNATSIKTIGSGQMSALQRFSRDYLIDRVQKDDANANGELQDALERLRDQMETNSESLDASTVSVSVALGGSNTGDGVVTVSKVRGDGRDLEFLIAETIKGTWSGTAFSFLGEQSESLLSADWPTGSGISTNITPKSADSSLLTNGSFDSEDDIPNVPDDWLLSVGTAGTDLKMTDVEVQTVTIGGTPTGGHYFLHWTNADGDQQTTAPLDHDATQSTVQAALRALDGLGSIEVSSSGTSPDFTHTVTFTGRGGDVAELTSTNNLTGGTPTISHATTSAGTAQVYRGSRAVEFVSDNSTLVTINQRVTGLSTETPYAFHMRMIASSTPTVGDMTIDLVDGIGGTVINDSEGTANSIVVDATNLSTSWQALSDLVGGETVFRMPTVVPSIVYLRIRISTAIDNAISVFFDDAALVTMRQLYDGGPYVSVLSGATSFEVDDTANITVTNDRAGLLNEWLHRNFDLAAKGLQFPTDSGGAETVPDAVVG